MGRSGAKSRTVGRAELAFLLSQVGAHASARFGERIEPLGLKPAHSGVLSAIDESDGLSQQALGEKLGLFPSRLVGVLDELEQRKLVERRDSPADRRSYALYLTRAGRETLAEINRIGHEHQDALCAALSESERAQLAGLLRRIADEQKLVPGVHPGFRKLAEGERWGSDMGQIRFRVRTLMIIVAVVALVLTLVIQGVLVKQAMMREREAQARAEVNRALAQAAAVRAVQAAQATEEKNAQMRKLIQEQSQTGGDKGKRW
jgi:DNA-binding MarR family transcriptional regulator